jgi:hypothetical protein
MIVNSVDSVHPSCQARGICRFLFESIEFMAPTPLFASFRLKAIIIGKISITLEKREFLPQLSSCTVPASQLMRYGQDDINYGFQWRVLQTLFRFLYLEVIIALWFISIVKHNHWSWKCKIVFRQRFNLEWKGSKIYLSTHEAQYYIKIVCDWNAERYSNSLFSLIHHLIELPLWDYPTEC